MVFLLIKQKTLVSIVHSHVPNPISHVALLLVKEVSFQLVKIMLRTVLYKLCLSFLGFFVVLLICHDFWRRQSLTGRVGLKMYRWLSDKCLQILQFLTLSLYALCFSKTIINIFSLSLSVSLNNMFV